MTSKHSVFVIALLVVALLVGAIATWNGVNHHYDAAWYIVYARGLQQGDGFTVPISSYNSPITVGTINQWPPLYPMVLALGFGVDLFTWARMLSVGLLMLLGVGVYALALPALNGQRWGAFVAALLAVTFPVVTREGFSYARSETLFTVLGVVFLWLMLRQTRTGQDVRYALWAAFVVVLLTLTRYVGVAFGLFGLVWSVVYAWRNRPRRWHPLAAFLLSFVPLGLYALYLKAVTGSLTGTQTTADSLSLAGIPLGLETMLREMLHGLTFAFRVVGLRSNWWGLLAAAVIVGVLVMIAWRTRSQSDWGNVFNTYHGLIVVYIAVYSMTFWALGARSAIITEETSRHYIVVFPLLVLLAVSVIARTNPPRWFWGGLVVLYLVSGLVALRVPAAGLTYNRADWRSDPLLHSMAERIPPDTLVHTQYTPYLSWLLGVDVPVRTFGSYDGGFARFACDDLIYPQPYTHAAFTMIDAAYLRDTPPEDVAAFMQDWAAPCGEVVDYENNGFTLFMLVALER